MPYLPSTPCRTLHYPEWHAPPPCFAHTVAGPRYRIHNPCSSLARPLHRIASLRAPKPPPPLVHPVLAYCSTSPAIPRWLSPRTTLPARQAILLRLSYLLTHGAGPGSPHTGPEPLRTPL